VASIVVSNCTFHNNGKLQIVDEIDFLPQETTDVGGALSCVGSKQTDYNHLQVLLQGSRYVLLQGLRYVLWQGLRYVLLQGSRYVHVSAAEKV
jgi:hypothetical protein